MEREGLDAYIISGTDPHNSEYLPEAWQQREWISGFTGSFGTVVITMTDAGLWTDTRYFIQAEKELTGTGIQMHKLRVPDAVDYPQWLAQVLKPDSKVGIDDFCMSVKEVEHLKEVLSPCRISVVEKTDLLGEIWLDRPALPQSPFFTLNKECSGADAREKIQGIRDFLKENGSDYIFFSCLDEIAWLYNIRGRDIAYNPLVISYAIIGREKAWLFVNPFKISPAISSALEKENIETRDYHHLFLFLDELKTDATFMADPNTLNAAVFRKLKTRFTVKECTSPVILKKAVKNQTEIAGFRKACVKDGIAMTRFLYWLEQNIGKQVITECSAAAALGKFRAECPDYISDSFHTISAYGKNAALPHYSATAESDTLLEKKGLYLVDSGGQYIYGTTDITRTIPLGELTEAEQKDYTLVLKGMIALDRCIFPQGTTGANIDIVARQPLWSNCQNYGHGTGHGIGHFLCVHEGPQDIRQTWKNQPLLPGMVTSDEPAMYREGSHGVRHENIILCKEVAKNEYGIWYGFETLTLCHFDVSGIEIKLLNQEEKDWLNAYHKKVYDILSPHLPPEERKWLQEKTRKI